MPELKASGYFLDIIKSDDRLKGFEDDLGIQLIARDLEYKVGITNKEIKQAIKELYYPSTEESLRQHLAYKTGYVRFKQPLRIYAELTSQTQVALKKDTLFTDGNYVYQIF